MPCRVNYLHAKKSPKKFQPRAEINFFFFQIEQVSLGVRDDPENSRPTTVSALWGVAVCHSVMNEEDSNINVLPGRRHSSQWGRGESEFIRILYSCAPWVAELRYAQYIIEAQNVQLSCAHENNEQSKLALTINWATFELRTSLRKPTLSWERWPRPLQTRTRLCRTMTTQPVGKIGARFNQERDSLRSVKTTSVFEHWKQISGKSKSSFQLRSKYTVP